MKIIHSSNPEFQTVYRNYRWLEEFKLARFPDRVPCDGFIVMDDGNVVGISVSFLEVEQENYTIEMPVWAFTRKYAKIGVKMTKQMIDQRKNVAFIGKIHKDQHSEYRASLLACKWIGFSVVSENDYCWIVKRVL